MRGESCLVFLERDSLEEYDAAMNTTETKIKFLFAPLFLILASGVAHAATEVTETRTGDLGRLYNGNEMLGVKPALGVINYNAADGSYTTRATYGLAGELNLAAPIGIDFTRYFVGVQTGAAYSHLGPSDSNFFGAGSEGNGGGANLLLIPANIKVAYSPLADRQFYRYRRDGFELAFDPERRTRLRRRFLQGSVAFDPPGRHLRAREERLHGFRGSRNRA
jgi:hypothetical protein